MMDANHSRIYQRARCYDVAFSFRDVAAECDSLAARVQRHLGHPPRSVVELAAGPARHAREFARRGVRATAIDAVPAMCEYAMERANEEGVTLLALVADMTDFRVAAPVELALLLMDSASYLLDNDASLRHLDAVAASLVDGGIYMLEMAHPRDCFAIGASANRSWTKEVDGLRVQTRWGAEGDRFDPVSQIEQVTVTMDWNGPDGSGQIIEVARQRRCTANEFDALVRASGHFEIIEWLGAIAPPVAFDNRPAAWRMVPVLRKRRAGGREALQPAPTSSTIVE